MTTTFQYQFIPIFKEKMASIFYWTLILCSTIVPRDLPTNIASYKENLFANTAKSRIRVTETKTIGITEEKKNIMISINYISRILEINR